MTDVQRTYPTPNDAERPSEPLPPTMRAVVHDRYGDADRLEIRRVPVPTPGAGQVLVRVAAASLNPLDWHVMTGTPYLARLSFGLRRPKQTVRGADVAGTVVALGDGADGLSVGDRVVGLAAGSFAEFALAKPGALAVVPDGITFAEAAALPVAAVTALQAVRDHAAVEPGHRVLINGAAGGVGTYAVQLAVAAGADVTGVCSTGNVEMIRQLGAHRVVDYTSEDWVDGTQYDAIIDNVGNRPVGDCVRSLVDGGRFVMVSGPKANRWLDPFRRVIAGKLRFIRSGRSFVMFTAVETTAELDQVLGHLVAGTVRSVVDRTVALDEVPDAMRHLATGHARAKIVVAVRPGDAD